MAHNHRCDRCKDVVFQMLRETYGKVQHDPKVEASARLDDHEGTPYHSALQTVYRNLVEVRGHDEWNSRKRSLPRCDYRIELPNGRLFIVELDEKQHFSRARAATFAGYPKILKLGFSADRWLSLCATINAKDNDPHDRDERRAWYDTLRDFLPLINSDYEPTVRVYMPDRVWCELDPTNPGDKSRFRQLLKDSAFGGLRPLIKSKRAFASHAVD